MSENKKIENILSGLSLSEQKKIIKQITEKSKAEKELQAQRKEIYAKFECGILDNNFYVFRELTKNNFITIINGEETIYKYEKAAAARFEEITKHLVKGAELVKVVKTYHETYNPFSDEMFFRKNEKDYYNKFKPSEVLKRVKTVRNEEKLIKNIDFLTKFPNYNILLKNLFVESEYLTYFIHFISYVVNTRKKLTHGVFLRGFEGAGKNVFWENFIVPVFGETNVAIVNNSDVVSQFNRLMENKLFVMFNEIFTTSLKEKYDIELKLKEWISDKDIRLEGKHETLEKRGVNYMNCLFFSNNQAPVKISSTDRRFSFFETSYDNLITVLKRHGLDFPTFEKGLKSEFDELVDCIINFDYDVKLLEQPLHTKEKEAVAESTSTVKEKLESKLKRKDLDWIWETCLDFLSPSEIIFHEDKEDVKKLFNFLKEVADGKIYNDSLYFIYNLFFDEKVSAKKIGSFWTVILGTPTTSAGKRFRKIKGDVIDFDYDLELSVKNQKLTKKELIVNNVNKPVISNTSIQTDSELEREAEELFG